MERFKSVEEYRNYFRELIEEERKSEKEFHLEEIKRLSPEERQRRGRAVLGLRMRYIGEFLDYKIYRFNRNNMPDHQIKVGDIVLVSKGEPLKLNQEATVSGVGRNFIEVMTKESIFRSKLYRLDLFVNDITFKRMEETLNRLESSRFPVEILLGHRSPKIEEVEISSEVLNPSQNRVFQFCLNSELFLIHGPPGTGKTTTLAEVIKQHIGKRLLVTADSNVAVDNLLERLKDFKVVRIGHPARIESSLTKYSLDVQVRRDSRYKEVEKLLKQIDNLKHLQEKRTKKPTPSRRRGMGDEQILKLAKEGRGFRGVPAQTIKEMAEWIKIQQKINQLYEQKNKITEGIVEGLLEGAEIIFATNSGAGSEFLADREFDVVFVDEGAQAMEPSVLIPGIKAPQLFIAGDHKQLPPTILSGRRELMETIFERFTKIYPEAAKTLQIQYRMNETLNHFPSCQFYNCEVKSAESVKNIRLSDISNPNQQIGGDVPLLFFDTCGRFLEAQKSGSPSKYNPKEGRFIRWLVEQCRASGVKDEWIGVITPYKDHEEYLKRLIEGVEIKSVDGFQGREKELIILSLVRANPNEEIGFLGDLRRFNVSITRAKRKLIVVGDAKTIGVHPVYRKFLEYVRERGKYIYITPALEREI
ncbi:MAG: IGHMBP2 family helicase [Campylobacterales bacterium]